MTTDDVTTVARNDRGQFVPGGGSGKPRGTLQKITKIMKEELSAHLEEHGIRANPLIILSRLAMDEEVHPAVRMQSADRLARFCFPRLLQVEMETTDTAALEVDMERVRVALRGVLSHEE